MALRQYGRVYRLIYGKQDSTEVEIPFTLDNIGGDNLRVAFNFSRTNFGEPDRGTITIYSLPEKIRKALKNDLENQRVARQRIQKLTDDATVRAQRLLDNAREFRVEFYAGYGGEANLELLFSGDLLNVTTMRRGNRETVTRIELGDTLLALRDSYISEVFAPGSQVINIMKTIVRHSGLQLSNGSENRVKAHLLANAVITVAQDTVYIVGRAPETITEYVDLLGGQWWVNDGVVEILPQGSVLPGFSIKLTEGEDLLDFNEQSVNDDVRGRALLNAHIAPGRGLILVGRDGERLDPLGYRVNQVVSTGDSEATPWYSDFLATGINSVIIPPSNLAFIESRGVNDEAIDLARERE